MMCNGGKCEVCGEKGPNCWGYGRYCMMHGGCGRHWLKWLLGIIILLVVFCAGFKLGALFSFWGRGYRSEVPVRYMMSGWGGRTGGSAYQQAPMMRYYYSSSTGSSTSTGGQ